MLKHFFKTLGIFVVMIILGLIGVYLINVFDQEGRLDSAFNAGV